MPAVREYLPIGRVKLLVNGAEGERFTTPVTGVRVAIPNMKYGKLGPLWEIVREVIASVTVSGCPVTSNSNDWDVTAEADGYDPAGPGLVIVMWLEFP